MLSDVRGTVLIIGEISGAGEKAFAYTMFGVFVMSFSFVDFLSI